jgi:uncharacterized protein YdaT
VVLVVDNNLIIISIVNKCKHENDPLNSDNQSAMSKKSTHVIPNPIGGWSVKQSGASRASNLFDTKQPAIERARELSARQHTELVIHNKDGKISGKDSRGHDPYPPRG